MVVLDFYFIPAMDIKSRNIAHAHVHPRKGLTRREQPNLTKPTTLSLKASCGAFELWN